MKIIITATNAQIMPRGVPILCNKYNGIIVFVAQLNWFLYKNKWFSTYWDVSLLKNKWKIKNIVFAGWLVGWLAGCLVCWAGWLAGSWLAAWSAGWLVGGWEPLAGILGWLAAEPCWLKLNLSMRYYEFSMSGTRFLAGWLPGCLAGWCGHADHTFRLLHESPITFYARR